MDYLQGLNSSYVHWKMVHTFDSHKHEQKHKQKDVHTINIWMRSTSYIDGWIILRHFPLVVHTSVFLFLCLCLSDKCEPGFQWKSENHERLKYVWNVYQVLTNHQQDLQLQKP